MGNPSRLPPDLSRLGSSDKRRVVIITAQSALHFRAHSEQEVCSHFRVIFVVFVLLPSLAARGQGEAWGLAIEEAASKWRQKLRRHYRREVGAWLVCVDI